MPISQAPRFGGVQPILMVKAAAGSLAMDEIELLLRDGFS